MAVMAKQDEVPVVVTVKSTASDNVMQLTGSAGPVLTPPADGTPD
jgi:hypothetical protein